MDIRIGAKTYAAKPSIYFKNIINGHQRIVGQASERPLQDLKIQMMSPQ
jgi:hypothetical protein